MLYTSTFLMRDGRVANLDAHLHRIREESVHTPDAVEQVRATLREAGTGVYRPLIQVDRTTIDVELHPSMVSREEVVVDAEGIFDQRRRPTRKGPDFGWQARQLNMLRHSGTDAGLLIDDRGMVIQGIFSAVLYLKDGAAHISAHPRATESITLNATLDLLTEAGVSVVEHPEGFAMPQLRGNETWLLDSVEGVRKVTGWLEYGSVLSPRDPNPPRMGAPTHREVNRQMWALASEV